MHSAFNFKFGNEHQGLGNQALAKFREQLKDLRVLIIDEVSLLGADMLYKIHLRLQEILQVDHPDGFAGITIVLVGDLLQLAPVKAKYIFEIPKNLHFKAYHQANPLWQKFEPMILTQNHRQGKIPINYYKKFPV